MITPILMLGAGRMGGAILEGWRRAGTFPADELMICDPEPSPPALAAALDGAQLNPPDADLARAIELLGRGMRVTAMIQDAELQLMDADRSVSMRPRMRMADGVLSPD